MFAPELLEPQVWTAEGASLGPGSSLVANTLAQLPRAAHSHWFVQREPEAHAGRMGSQLGSSRGTVTPPQGQDDSGQEAHRPCPHQPHAPHGDERALVCGDAWGPTHREG